jgi:small subunit ribosomal protein S4
MKLFLKGSQVRRAEVPVRVPSLPARPARPRPARRRPSTSCSCAEKQKARRVYGILEKQFRGYYEEAVPKPGKTGEVAAADPLSRRGLDNVVYRAGYAPFPRRGPPAGAGTAIILGQRAQGRHPVVPASVDEHDREQVREKSRAS